MLSDTLADGALPPAQSQHNFSVAKSVTSTARAKMRACIGVTGNTRSANGLRRRAIALRHSRRPAQSEHHFSMPENLSSPQPTPSRVQASVQSGTKCNQTACDVAPSLPDTLADFAPPRAPSHNRSSMLKSRSRLPVGVYLPRQHACKHRHGRIPNVSKLPAPSRHRFLTPSQTVRASRRSPIIVSDWSKICPIDRLCQHGCKRRSVNG